MMTAPDFIHVRQTCQGRFRSRGWEACGSVPANLADLDIGVPE